MERDWREDLSKFEGFLENIDMEKYRHLRQIKTVEQDLPRELLPLELFYRYYWDTTDFKDFDAIFSIYWLEKLNPHIYNFIKKYFYGCSLQFVEEGFRARLYRIWMSILTQFHFQYLWNSMFEERLSSSAELDMLGIDAMAEMKKHKVGFQIKKISYRREASERRFTKKQQKYVDVIVEVPYITIDVQELKDKLKNPRVRESSKSKYKRLITLFEENFNKLRNGFVVFKSEYLNHIRLTVLDALKHAQRGSKLSYENILKL